MRNKENGSDKNDATKREVNATSPTSIRVRKTQQQQKRSRAFSQFTTVCASNARINRVQLRGESPSGCCTYRDVRRSPRRQEIRASRGSPRAGSPHRTNPRGQPPPPEPPCMTRSTGFETLAFTCPRLPLFPPWHAELLPACLSLTFVFTSEPLFAPTASNRFLTLNAVELRLGFHATKCSLREPLKLLSLPDSDLSKPGIPGGND